MPKYHRYRSHMIYKNDEPWDARWLIVCPTGTTLGLDFSSLAVAKREVDSLLGPRVETGNLFGQEPHTGKNHE